MIKHEKMIKHEMIKLSIAARFLDCMLKWICMLAYIEMWALCDQVCFDFGFLNFLSELFVIFSLTEISNFFPKLFGKIK